MATIASYNKRLESLRSERSSFISEWRELSDYHLAHRGRFLTSDRNKGHKRNTRQINNTSRLAARTLASGMMAGITSPARPWFQLSSGDADLNETAAVKEWLHAVQTMMYRVFAASNVYNSLHTVYGELGVFGTAPMGVYRDFDNVIWCKPYTVGSYMLAANGQNQVDTFYREYEITVAQCVKEFGIDNCSQAVKQMWERGNSEAWVKVVHVVEPNDDRDMQSPLAKDKAWRSVYYESPKGTNNRGDLSEKALRRSGFDEFPILAPRWDTTGEDIYATDCPGMIAIGDTKALQLGEKRKFQAIDKMANPPLQAPASLRTKLSGGVLKPDEILFADGQGVVSSIYGNWRPDLGALMQVNAESEERIRRAFYEDLFLMLSMSDRRQITAREVAEKHEEKLLMLGPVLERLHTELLDPLIDRTFSILQESGVLPIPPQELQGREMAVEYVSVLAQAQRMVSVSGLEQVGAYASNLSQIWPEARHKFDALQAIDEYSTSIGVNPKVIRSDDEVQAMVEADQQAQAQAAAMQQGQAMADTAKTVSDTNLGDENALTTMMRNAGLM